MNYREDEERRLIHSCHDLHRKLYARLISAERDASHRGILLEEPLTYSKDESEGDGFGWPDRRNAPSTFEEARAIVKKISGRIQYVQEQIELYKAKRTSDEYKQSAKWLKGIAELHGIEQ